LECCPRSGHMLTSRVRAVFSKKGKAATRLTIILNRNILKQGLVTAASRDIKLHKPRVRTQPFEHTNNKDTTYKLTSISSHLELRKTNWTVHYLLVVVWFQGLPEIAELTTPHLQPPTVDEQVEALPASCRLSDRQAPRHCGQ
jgi:hypothetical protein